MSRYSNGLQKRTKLSQEMIRQGFTSDEMAEKLGLSLYSVKLYRAGKVIPNLYTALVIGKLLHKSVEELFFDDLESGLSTSNFGEGSAIVKKVEKNYK